MSKIEWTEQTWNPVVGCSIVSPGCSNCYAMKMAARCAAMGISRYDGLTKAVNGNTVWTGKLAQAPDATLMEPLHRKKPTTYFVNSMSDLFHEDCPGEWIEAVFAVMALCPQHKFQILTKRSKRMRSEVIRIGTSIDILERHARSFGRSLQWDVPSDLPSPLAGKRVGLVSWPLPNVWLGVSTERQIEADERIHDLLNTPAAIRFISAEPLLSPINLTSINHRGVVGGHSALHDRGLGKLDWVIVGGESGHGYRYMNPAWAAVILDQCQAADVPVFMKQMSGKKPIPPELMIRQLPKETT